MRSQAHKNGPLGTSSFANSSSLQQGTVVLGTSVVGNPASAQPLPVPKAPPAAAKGTGTGTGTKTTRSKSK